MLQELALILLEQLKIVNNKIKELHTLTDIPVDQSNFGQVFALEVQKEKLARVSRALQAALVEIAEM